MHAELPGYLRHLMFRQYGSKGIRHGLRISLQAPPLSLDGPETTAVMRSIDWKAGDLMVSDHMRSQDPASRGHLEWIAWILSSYQVLEPRFQSNEEVISFLEEASLRGFNTRSFRTGIRLALRGIKNGNMDQAEKIYSTILRQFGVDFESTSNVQNGSLDFDITFTFMAEVFNRHEVPELKSVMCKPIELCFAHLDSMRHGLAMQQMDGDADEENASAYRFSVTHTGVTA